MGRKTVVRVRWWHLVRQGEDGRGLKREDPVSRARRRLNPRLPAEPADERLWWNDGVRDYYRPDWVRFGQQLFDHIAYSPRYGNATINQGTGGLGIHDRRYAQDLRTSPRMVRKVLLGQHPIPANAILGDGRPCWLTPLELDEAKLKELTVTAWLCQAPIKVVDHVEWLTGKYAVLRARNKDLRLQMKRLLQQAQEQGLRFDID